MSLQHKRSSIAHKRPVATSLNDGQLALNLNATSPGVFFKNSSNVLTKVGPVHVGTSAPNSSPATGGSTGNSIGEQWLDTTGGTYVLKIWDGTAWRSESGTFVDVSGDTMTGALILPSGTEAAPALGVGSSDNGLYLPATDELGVSTNGSERLRIDSSGDIGIGTTSPDGTLHVHTATAGSVSANASADNLIVENSGAGGISILTPNASAGGLFFGSPGDNIGAALRWNHDNDQFQIGPDKSGAHLRLNSGDGVEAMRIASDGDVGIGTSSPITKLHVQQSAVTSAPSRSAALYLENNANCEIQFVGNSSNDCQLRFGTTSNSFKGALEYELDNDNLKAYTDGTERMRITDVGNVGIGTTSPDTSLEVVSSGATGISSKSTATQATDTNKALKVRNNSTTDTFNVSYKGQGYFAGNVGIGTSSPGNELVINNSATGANTKLEIKQSGGGGGTSEILFSDSVEGRGRIYFDHGSSPEGIKFDTAGSFAAIIDTSGNVGIGTTSPSSLLHLESASSPKLLLVDTTNSCTLKAYAQNSNAHLGTESSHDFIFDTNNTERMRIDSSGNVGIGTTSPRGLVHLHSSSAPRLDFTNTATGTGSGDGATISVDGSSGALNIIQRESQPIQFYTDATERLRIDSSGRLLIGATSARTNFNNGSASPQIQIENVSNGNNSSIALIHNENATSDSSALNFGKTRGGSVGDNSALNQAGDRLGTITFQGNDGTEFVQAASIEGFTDASPGANDMPGRLVFSTTSDGSSSPTERMRIDSSGRVAIGTTSATTDAQLTVADLDSPMLSFERTNAGLFDAAIGMDNSNDLSFFTGANSSTVAGLTERMRITSDGFIQAGTTENHIFAASINNASNSALFAEQRNGSGNGACAKFNRSASDGNLINFQQASTTEGTITVSGSTVSYNGGHLSRWSQLAGGAERTEILRGTVLSNLNEMCVWAYSAQDAVLYTEEDELPEGASVGDVKTPAVAAGTEDNEQLNRMKVSDVEGDVNVAGVFQSWDDGDDTYTNDFYCAMTGDFIIRIAQGTTVARGDLLMSAGDGTAKPQDDDIVRSKTIAKVTSTTVSTTYTDGSYCVPCVLMAC